MIFSFSGTGNSRYIASYLADHLEDELVDITTYTRTNSFGQFQSDKPYVVVCPVYVSAPPMIVMDFIRYSSFVKSRKWYFIMTCAGGMGACPTYWKEICLDKGFDYMGCEQVVMPQNYLAYFHTKEKEENRKIIESAIQNLPSIVEAIDKGKAISLKEAKTYENVSTKMILKSYYKFFMKTDKFSVNEDCIHCGVCQRSCPLNNIRLVDGKPVWANNCTHCMACINLCPKKAIEYGKNSKGKPRYKAPVYTK